MSIRTRHWFIAFICAIALQVAAAVALLPSTAPAPISTGAEGIDISLALAGPVASGNGGEPADLQPLALPELPPLPEPPPLKPEPKPEPKLRPKPKAKAVAKPQPQPPAAPATRSAPQLAEMTVPQSAPPAGLIAAAQGPRSERPGNTGSNRRGEAQGGGSNAARQSYYGQLAAALNRHKRYPYAARRARQEGVVKVRFVIDARGNVVEHGIDTSSGYRALDEAVIDMVEKASPLPAIPAELGRNQLAIVLPIEFSLRHR